MAAAIAHVDSLQTDDTFHDKRVCASRVSTRLFEPARQPVRDGDLVLWIDGEILDEGGPAVIFDGYRRDPGFSFLRNVGGFFVAVLYDAAAGKLHLISDRQGFRHLFWTRHGDSLWWGTELKALFELEGYSPRIDADAVSRYAADGFFPGERSWFSGVELVPGGTVLSWNLASGDMQRRQYWNWSEIGAVDIPRDRRELIEEWGRLFTASVARCCRDGRVGALLSGGLDSRAIVAAIPATVDPLHVVTFGRPDSPDVRIAATVAAKRGAIHHIQEMSEHNWLPPRFRGIWWSDGQLNLIDLHGVAGYEERRAWFDINLSGFLGDVTMGGSYLRKGDDELTAIRERGRRFVGAGLKMHTLYFDNRLPFFNDDLLEFTLAISPALRAKKHIYADMLLHHFPDMFRTIPWQETGVPITWPLPLARISKRARSAIGRITGTLDARRSFASYDQWFRHEPARSLIGDILTAPDALFAELLPRETVVGAWNRLQSGGNLSREVGLYATMEIWLQQAFNARFREPPDGAVTT